MKFDTKIHDSTEQRIRTLTSIKRWILACLGLICVGLAVLGVLLPGLPTTIFLIAAAYLFTRSCPRLERILIRNRFFSAFHHYLDGKSRMPVRAKVVTLLLMWVCISVSCLTLLMSDRVSPYLIAIIPLAGIVGSYFVSTHGNKLDV